ncbi:unnamed protein product, partial [Rotaria sordida]
MNQSKKIFRIRNLFYFILLHLINATPQINLYYTHWLSERNDNNGLQHDCLRVPVAIEESESHYQMILYCMNELSSKFNIEKKNILFRNFTFDQLSKQNITSQQLYLWLTPIDIIENYQFYLNQLSTTLNESSSSSSSLRKEIFYNCTLPRFGLMCQYELYNHYSYHSSLYEIIYDFYHNYFYTMTNLTCYRHLKCNRGPDPSCLDWSKICDGKVDCLDGEFDEEYCWQIEINKCKDNEFQCPNGQCIPESFIHDNINISYCLDGNDDPCRRREPSFGCEDIRCDNTPITSSSRQP